MKYKIKIITRNNGQQIFWVYEKTKILRPWSFYGGYDAREKALDAIDYSYGMKEKSIEVEYINKP